MRSIFLLRFLKSNTTSPKFKSIDVVLIKLLFTRPLWVLTQISHPRDVDHKSRTKGGEIYFYMNYFPIDEIIFFYKAVSTLQNTEDLFHMWAHVFCRPAELCVCVWWRRHWEKSAVFSGVRSKSRVECVEGASKLSRNALAINFSAPPNDIVLLPWTPQWLFGGRPKLTRT